jgi:Uma2 family endonuclease
MADDARLSLPQAMDADRAPGPLRLSDAEYARLIETGAAERLGRVELRGGELWRMSPQYAPHMRMKLAVWRALEAALAGGPFEVGLEVTVAFPGFMPDPDVSVFARKDFRKSIPGEAVSLIIEIAFSTLEDDLGDKKDRYAAAGVREYWVVDMPHAQVLRFHVPRDGQFQAADVVTAGETCASLTLEGVALDTAAWPWDQGED